jgi:hypothetical protein
LRICVPKISESSIRSRLALLLLALAAHAVQAPGQVPGTARDWVVEGRVVRPSSTGEIPTPGVVVTIHRVGPDSAGPIDSVRTDARGAYRFAYRRWGDPTALYFTAAVYRGIAYFSAPLRQPTVQGDDAEIVVFDTTTAPVRFTIQGHHLIIGAPRPTGLRDIVEVYEVSNDTVVTKVGRDSLDAVWSAPLPKGAQGFTAGQGDVAASSLERRGDRVVLLAPFAPGVKQLSFTYALPANAFPLELTLDQVNGLLEVLLEEPGAQVRSPSLRAQGTATTQGRTFKRFLAQNAPAGERVRIDVPSTSATARTTVVVALAVGVAAAMLLALFVAYRRGARARPAAAPAESIESLASAIAALDARRDANDPALSAAAYETERAALKARLAAALAGGARAT